MLEFNMTIVSQIAKKTCSNKSKIKVRKIVLKKFLSPKSS